MPLRPVSCFCPQGVDVIPKRLMQAISKREMANTSMAPHYYYCYNKCYYYHVITELTVPSQAVARGLMVDVKYLVPLLACY